jgi:hypothetical protein
MQGRYVRYAFPAGNDIRDIAIDATLRAAAPYQQTREANGTAVSITKSDIRVKVRERRTATQRLCRGCKRVMVQETDDGREGSNSFALNDPIKA